VKYKTKYTIIIEQIDDCRFVSPLCSDGLLFYYKLINHPQSHTPHTPSINICRHTTFAIFVSV